jgi:hypothetical protein
VTPFVRTQLVVQKVMVTVFFTSKRLIVCEALPKGRKFNQGYFISIVLPELVKMTIMEKKARTSHPDPYGQFHPP